MTTLPDQASGLHDEMGWGDVDDAKRLGSLRGSALLLAAASAHFVLVWVSSGLLPLGFAAGQLRRDRVALSKQHMSSWRRH